MWLVRQAAHVKGFMADRFANSEVPVNSYNLASPKRCKNASVIAKRRRPSAPADSSTSLRSRSFTTSPLVRVEEVVDFRLMIGCL